MEGVYGPQATRTRRDFRAQCEEGQVSAQTGDGWPLGAMVRNCTHYRTERAEIGAPTVAGAASGDYMAAGCSKSGAEYSDRIIGGRDHDILGRLVGVSGRLRGFDRSRNRQ